MMGNGKHDSKYCTQEECLVNDNCQTIFLTIESYKYMYENYFTSYSMSLHMSQDNKSAKNASNKTASRNEDVTTLFSCIEDVLTLFVNSRNLFT